MNRLLCLLPLLAVFFVASVAHADALPPEACTGAPGDACDTAGPNYDQPGICVEDTCHNAFKDASSACLLCKQVDGGLDAAAPDAEAVPPEAWEDRMPVAYPEPASPPPNTKLGSSSSGCAMLPFGVTAGSGVGLLVLSAAAALGARKRRKE